MKTPYPEVFTIHLPAKSWDEVPCPPHQTLEKPTSRRSSCPTHWKPGRKSNSTEIMGLCSIYYFWFIIK